MNLICLFFYLFIDLFIFLRFTQKFKMAANTLWVKNFVKIALSRSVSEINMFLHFTKKFKMAESGGKMIFAKSRQ